MDKISLLNLWKNSVFWMDKRLEERKRPILVAYYFGLHGNLRNYNANIQRAPGTIIWT